MISQATLDEAVARALISAEQAAALRALAAEPAPRQTYDEDERLRFVSGFGDIFVTIGVALFLVAVGWLCSERIGPIATLGLVAALSWGSPSSSPPRGAWRCRASLCSACSSAR